MIILTPDIEIKSIYVMPRNNNFDVLQMTDDSTNIPVQFSIVDWIDHDYYVELEVDFNVELTENRFYDMVIFDDQSNVVFKDRVYCTSQDVFTYSVNNNPDNTSKYKSKNTENSYITYGE